MSYPNNQPVGGGKYTQFVAYEPTVLPPVPPTYEKITPEQLQILEYATTGNLAGIQKMVAEHKTPRGLMPDKLVNCTIPSAKSHSWRENGWTPLMWAIKGGHVKCVAALYEAGARTDGRFTHELGAPETPWEYMVRWGEYDLNPLMYAVMLVSEGKIDIECVRVLFARRKGSSVPPTNMHQTERSHLIQEVFYGEEGNKLSALTLAIRMSNHNRQSLTNYKITFSKLIELIKLLLENRVLVRRSDFLIFNLQNTEILKLLLADVEETIAIRCDYLLPMINDEGYLDEDYDFTHFNDSVDADYLLRISHHLYASANVLLDYYTSHKIIHPNPDGNKFFAEVIRCQVSEMVRACVERKLPVSGNIKMDGRITSVSWDILRELSAYRERRGEDVNLSPELVQKIIHNKNFLVTFVDVDVLTGFGVPADSCKWGNKVDHPYHYSSHITKVLPRNLEFALKHGFDLKPPHNGFFLSLPTILVHVNNQTEFTKAFFFMKNSRVIIDLGGKVYRLPKADIDDNSEFYRKYARIQNGRVVDASDNVPSEQAWAEHFANVQISEGPLPFEKGDIVAIQQTGGRLGPQRDLDISRLSGELEETPVNGWYRLVGHTKPVRAGQGDVSFCDIPAAHVIMNAQLHESNLILLGENDIDEFNFEDDYWSAQTAETLGEMTWGSYKGEDIIHLLLDHPWNQADIYEDGDVFNIFQRFVEQGAFVPNIFCQALLDNAQWFPIVDAINIYDKLRANCPGYIFGKDEQREFDKFVEFTLGVQDTAEQLKIFEHVLEVENSGEDTYFPNFPLYIPKLCDIFRGKVYEPGAYLATFLNEHAKDVSSAIVVDCINQMLAAGFDINYNQHPDILIPLFYVLDNGNELVLDEFLKHPDLDINQNVNINIELTALESLMLDINDRDTARIMIHKMLQDDRVECPFRQHTLSPDKVDEAPEIVDFLLHRKYFGGPQDKPSEWYFDPNTAPNPDSQFYWRKRLQEQGVEPQWQDKEDEYTKKVCTNMPAAAKVVHWRGLALQHLPWRLRKISPVVRKAVRSNGLALQFVTARHMMSWAIVQDAIVQNWRAYQFLPQKAMYERVKEPVPFEDREDVQELLVYDEKLNEYIHGMFEDFSQGHVYEKEDVIDNIKDVSEREDLDTIAKKILVVMKKIHSSWVSEPYEYRGLPSQSEPGFVIWMRHLFQEGAPHEGEWPEFEKMFPEAAAYAEMNQNTHEGQKEIEEEKSSERKEIEKEPIKKLRDAVHAQLDKDVDIVHWDDFEPIRFS